MKLREAYTNPFGKYNAVNTQRTNLRGLLFKLSNGNGLEYDDTVKVHSETNGEYAVQREYCWSESDKQEYIISVLRQTAYGVFIFVNDTKNMRCQVLDGKQRMSAIRDFVFGDLAIPMPDGTSVKYKGLPKDEQSALKNDGMLNIIEFDHYGELPEKDVLDIFLTINTSGKTQSQDHINNLKTKRQNVR